jgi:predicted permease
MTEDELRSRAHFELGIHRPELAAGDADQELASLLEEQVHHLTAQGLTPDAARAEALRRLGPALPAATLALHRSAEHRERRMRLHDWLTDLSGDLRRAVRTLRRSPAMAGAAIATLALAIGANTAIFSAVSAVMLRPLPFTEPARLVSLWEHNPDFNWYQQDAAPANMLDWRDQAGVFSGVAGYFSFAGSTTLTGRGEPRLLRTQQVTGDFFSVLGVEPALGRNLTEAESWDNTPRVALLSHKTWREVFGADRGIVGKSIELGGRPVEVIGVLPERFSFPGSDAELWQPVRWDPGARGQVWFRRAHFVRVIGRLKPEVTLEQADAALQVVVKRLAQDFPETNVHMGAGITPLHEFIVGKTRLPLLVMLGAVALLLLIACVNVANLLLVRASGQEREASVRLALGAGRGRLFRQALAESAVLAAAGGLAGVGLGWWGTRVLARLQPAGMLPVQDISMSGGVLLYAALATTLAALIFGIAPTVWTIRRVPADVLREEGRTASGSVRARRWGEGLLVTQVALALALTLGAGLLVRSYLLLQRVEPGFDTRQVLAVSVNLPGIRFDSLHKVLGFYRQLERDTRGLPGVTAAALVSAVPLGPPSWSSEFAIAGRPPMARGGEVVHREITPDYQKVLRVELLKGRAFTDADREDAPRVVLINQALARLYFAGEDPVGQRIAFDREPDSSSVWRTIVGVVHDERQRGLAEPARPEIFASFPQEPRNGMTLVVRTQGDPLALAPAIRQLVARLDPLLAISSIRSMDAVRNASLARDRFLTILMLSFAGVGLLLGIVGIYGVMAQLARRRMREMGIRLALGASAGQLQWLVVRKGLALTGLGLAGGVVLAVGGTQMIRTLLFQVAPVDPLTYGSVAALVLLTAGLASWLPAARASRADPCSVLRSD